MACNVNRVTRTIGWLLFALSYVTSAAAARELPRLEHFSVNDLHVALAHWERDRDVVLEAVVQVGNGTDELAPPGAIGLALRLAKWDGDWEVTQAQLDEWGAKVESGVELSRSFIRLTTPHDHLDEVVALLSRVLRHPVFNEIDVEAGKQGMRSNYERELDDDAELAGRMTERMLFGEDHPLVRSYPTARTVLQLPEIRPETLHALYARSVRPDNLTLLVTGNVTQRELRPLFERYFGSWRAPARPLRHPAFRPVARQARPGMFLVNTPNSRARIVVASVLDPETIPEYNAAALLAFSAFAAGQENSRVNQALVDVKPPLTDKVGMTQVETGSQPSFAVRLWTDPENVATTLQIIRRELSDLVGRRPPARDSIERLRASLLEQFDFSTASTRDIAMRYHEILLRELRENLYTILTSELHALTPEKVQMAGRLLGIPDSLTWVIFGDTEKIAPQLRNLTGETGAFGTLTLLDKSDLWERTIPTSDARAGR